MRLLKHALVTGLEKIDHLLDQVPSASLSRDREGRTVTMTFYRHGGWGCLLGLGNLSVNLNDRWNLEVWR